ncbi:ABC transporter ATP-binding protein [Pedobacter glucosidilyticus]|uniref:ABC transporter ATP-binding protein n=1 Tax=Pedobacter glucosidilyticus TaxID=1122941 RepID=UPI0026EB866B|nr:ABC transporter ATP-binding protein [Pedobacter glucosidilyticus]
MGVAIKVENLSKQYRLGKIGTGSIAHDLNKWWHTVRGKENPYLKIGETNDRSTKGNSDYVWSLKDINFEIEQGDAVGIIGRNGAGKSTLLKILSRVTGPTTGSVKVKGRIASLLEVGTGFHPELSGRENIFLNGAILGMRKHEIQRQFDEIVDFAGVERYIDTPVKRYSSGMYVRLAFAVAAHLQSEILIVDEVLAVGDAEFQKKCLGKMNDVSKGEGRTVLFVSHNMNSIKTLCHSGIYLKNGCLNSTSNKMEELIDLYIDQELFGFEKRVPISLRKDRTGNGNATIMELNLKNSIDEETIKVGNQIILNISYKSKLQSFRGHLLISINNKNGDCVLFMDSQTMESFSLNFSKNGDIEIKLSKDFGLPEGKYFLNIALFVNLEIADYIQSALVFNVVEGQFYETGRMPSGKSICYVKQQWSYLQI